MKSTLIKFFTVLICGFVVITPFFTNPTHASSICDIPCTGEGASACQEIKKANGCGGQSSNLSTVITNILSAIIGVSGIVAVIFIVVGGVSYMTSAGDAGKLSKAKNTILYACIGLAICALAFVIVNFVIKSILKQNTTTSSITTTSQIITLC